MQDCHRNMHSRAQNKDKADIFLKKYLVSIWNSIWQNWVFGIWGQIQILGKYLVFGVKYKYLKVFGIPNKLKVFDPALYIYIYIYTYL